MSRAHTCAHMYVVYVSRLFMTLTRSHGSGAHIKDGPVGLSSGIYRVDSEYINGVTVAAVQAATAAAVFLDSPAPGGLALCQGRVLRRPRRIKRTTTFCLANFQREKVRTLHTASQNTRCPGQMTDEHYYGDVDDKKKKRTLNTTAGILDESRESLNETSHARA